MTDKVIIGDAELYHGDCMDILPMLAYEDVGAIVTDPPYGIYNNGGKWGRKTELIWDKGTSQDMVTYLLDITGNLGGKLL